MARTALATSRSEAGSASDITVVPLLNDGRVIAIRVFTTPYALESGQDHLYKEPEVHGLELHDRSASYSDRYRLDEDKKSFRLNGTTSSMGKFTLNIFGVAIIDLPSRHQVFAAIRDENSSNKPGGLLLINAANAPYYRHATRDIVARLESVGFFGTPGFRSAKVLAFPAPKRT